MPGRPRSCCLHTLICSKNIHLKSLANVEPFFSDQKQEGDYPRHTGLLRTMNAGLAVAQFHSQNHIHSTHMRIYTPKYTCDYSQQCPQTIASQVLKQAKIVRN